MVLACFYMVGVVSLSAVLQIFKKIPRQEFFFFHLEKKILCLIIIADIQMIHSISN